VPGYCCAFAIPPPGHNRLKNDVSNYAGHVSCRHSESSRRWQIDEIPVGAWTGGGTALPSLADVTLPMLEVLTVR